MYPKQLLTGLILLLAIVTRVQALQMPSACDQTVKPLPAGILAVTTRPLTALMETGSSILTIQLETGTLVHVINNPQCQDGLIQRQIAFPGGTSGEFAWGWVTAVPSGTPNDKRWEFPLQPVPQTFDVPSPTDTITPTNLNRLQPVGAVEYAWPVDLIWSPDSRYLAINMLGGVWVHDLHTPKGVAVLMAQPTFITPLGSGYGAVQFNGNVLAVTGTPDGDLTLWNLNDGTFRIINIASPAYYTHTAAISPDLSRWATAYGDGSVRLWSVDTGQLLAEMNGHTIVGALAFSPDGSILASDGGYHYVSESGPPDSSFRLWDAQNGQQLAVFDLPRQNPWISGQNTPIAFVPGDHTVAVPHVLDRGWQDYEWTMYFINLAHRRLDSQWQLEENGSLGRFSFSPDGSLIAVVGFLGVGLLDISTGRLLHHLSFDYPVLDVAFSPDGKWLAISYEGGRLPGISKVELSAIS
ncbi:MAG: PD40 domain-containing protein [Chloroflexi bacterium]|nr:PD40 domain-containing protein [Chloroflexota bacterium]